MTSTIWLVKSIGTHHHVTVYAVAGWQAGVDRDEERYGATCEHCGVWRGPSPAAVEQQLVAAPCEVPPAVLLGLLAPSVSLSEFDSRDHGQGPLRG